MAPKKWCLVNHKGQITTFVELEGRKKKTMDGSLNYILRQQSVCLNIFKVLILYFYTFSGTPFSETTMI